ncbi:unnamed protein product [Didymodactylos carnosus]|uniref:Far11/STRP C-terminal domain-containing protein n=1 Tax=Didymodactylos carnosus TaxID=1234261 RepID=A0A814QXB9_9BILA|nr:unnamed protein product [Didymodactylos carnosus]CAF3888580.1 unnamed protein product [Didymodactylos carnosus]
MDPNGIVRRGILKPRDVILRNSLINPEALLDVPEFNFVYGDSDTLSAEIADNSALQWKNLSLEDKKDFIIYLLEQCELVNKDSRCSVLRALLYLIQGVFYQSSDVNEYITNVKQNIFIFYSCDGVQIFIDQFNMELERLCHDSSLKMINKNLSDNQNLRIIICVLYTVIEFARKLPDSDKDWLCLKKSLKHDLSHPNDNGELFANTLFHSICLFCNAQPSPPLPIRKLLLLLWKLILFTLGGIEDAFEQKNIMRQKQNLSPITENPSKVIKKMQPISPPLAGAECLDIQQNESGNSNTRRAKRQSFTKQSVLDGDSEDSPNLNSTSSTPIPLTNPSSNDDDNGLLLVSSSTSNSSIDTSLNLEDPTVLLNRELPWLPKVRQKDLETFLDHTRKKFVGFTIKDDLNTLIGLPKPIHESVKILKQHLYISLSEIQMQHEDEIAKYPLSKKEKVIPDTPSERLYRETLPQIPQFLIALLKLLLTSTPTAKPKSESINILCDVIPEEMPTTMVQTMKLGFDINRHKNVSDNENYCWRNMFSSINLLRILNKLTKEKHARTMVLVAVKSAPFLRKTLRVKQAMMQLYTLKLLKLQTRYLGRQWRKSNMMVISAIYQRVRHRLNDDWVYGNESQSWDFQTEERALRNKIDFFNHRRYCTSSNSKMHNSSTQNVGVHQLSNEYQHSQIFDNDYFSSNNTNQDLITALSTINFDNHDLPETFKRNYEQWLDQEVYEQQVEWDLLLRQKAMVIY